MPAQGPVRPAFEGIHPLLGDATIHTGYPHVVDWLDDNLPGPLAADIETYGLGLDMLRIKCVTLATPRGCVVLNPREERDAHHLRRALDAASAIVVHHGPADVPSLCRNRLMRPAHIAKVIDTLLLARVADPGSLASLDHCAGKWLGLPVSKINAMFKAAGMTISEGYRRTDIDTPAYLMGAGADGVVTARLWPVVYRAAMDRLTAGHPFNLTGLDRDGAARELEKLQRISRLFLRRTVRGLRVDFDYLERFKAENESERHKAERELNELGIDPGNGNHLAAFLERVGGLPADHPRTAKTGKPSTQAKHLEVLHHPVAKLFVAQKRTAKVQDDYLTKVVTMADENERIHPVTNVLAAVTGRTSMGDPPLHQFPWNARPIVLGDDDDGLGSIDWSQIEPVLSANLAGETSALEGYEAGVTDLYTQLGVNSGRLPAGTTPEMCESGPLKYARGGLKKILLGSLYGEGIKHMAQELGISLQEAQALKAQVFQPIPKIAAMIMRMRADAKRFRMCMTVAGRIIPIPMGPGFDGMPPGVQTHLGINYPHQGGAADMYMDALLAVDDAGLGDAVHLGMHDELIVSARAAVDVQRIMERPPERLIMMAGRTPILRTDLAYTGRSWTSA